MGTGRLAKTISKTMTARAQSGYSKVISEACPEKNIKKVCCSMKSVSTLHCLNFHTINNRLILPKRNNDNIFSPAAGLQHVTPFQPQYSPYRAFIPGGVRGPFKNHPQQTGGQKSDHGQQAHILPKIFVHHRGAPFQHIFNVIQEAAKKKKKRNPKYDEKHPNRS